MSILADISKNIINLPRYAKRTIAIIIDIGLCILCVWFAFYLRLEQFIKINDVTILAVLISISLAIPIFWISGLYKTMFRFASSSIIVNVAIETPDLKKIDNFTVKMIGDYESVKQYSQTLNNEKRLIKLLSDNLADKILEQLSLKLDDL